MFSGFSPKCSVSVSQQSNDLKDALDAEMEKTRLMEESMKKLDEVEISASALCSKKLNRSKKI